MKKCIGCGSVGIAVTSNSRGPLFESSHWQKIILIIYFQLYRKDENKEKEAGNGPFLIMKNAKEHKIQLSVNIHGLPTELVPKISVEKVLKFSSTKSKI